MEHSFEKRMGHRETEHPSPKVWPHSALALIAVGFGGLVFLLGGRGLDPLAAAAGAISAILILAGLGMTARRLQTLIHSLAEAATTDPLTGLLNRRGFQEAFDRELERAKRDGSPLALVVADLDDFKAVNDRLGHLGGDMALERTGGAISRSIRKMDMAARLGGEEFAILVPGAVSLEAFALAERIRARIESAFAGTAAQVTISAGVASYPGEGEGTEEIFGAADEAMYTAKGLGKNRSVVARPERAEEHPESVPSAAGLGGLHAQGAVPRA